MASRIKGITVEIGGDTTKLETALKGVNKGIKNTQSQLKDVEKLLKLDPGNTELLAQKQKLLSDAISETKDYASYYVENHHEAIVSKELWEKAKERLDRKQTEVERGLHTRTDSHFLKGRIVCGECGSYYTRVKRYGENIYWNWICQDRRDKKKGEGCKNKILKEDYLFKKLNEFLGLEDS